MEQFVRIEDVLEQKLQGQELAEVKRILYGPETSYVVSSSNIFLDFYL